jgi:hypothetical protein
VRRYSIDALAVNTEPSSEWIDRRWKWYQNKHFTAYSLFQEWNERLTVPEFHQKVHNTLFNDKPRSIKECWDSIANTPASDPRKTVMYTIPTRMEIDPEKGSTMHFDVPHDMSAREFASAVIFSMANKKYIPIPLEQTAFTGHSVVAFSQTELDMALASSEEKLNYKEKHMHHAVLNFSKKVVLKLDEYVEKLSKQDFVDDITALYIVYAYQLLRKEERCFQVIQEFGLFERTFETEDSRKFFHIVYIRCCNGDSKSAIRHYERLADKNDPVLDTIEFWQEFTDILSNTCDLSTIYKYVTEMIEHKITPDAYIVINLIRKVSNPQRAIIIANSFEEKFGIRDYRIDTMIIHKCVEANHFEAMMEWYEGCKTKEASRFGIEHGTIYNLVMEGHYRKIKSLQDKEAKNAVVMSALQVVQDQQEIAKIAGVQVMLMMMRIYAENGEIKPMWQVIHKIIRLNQLQYVGHEPYSIMLRIAAKKKSAYDLDRIYRDMTRWQIIAKDLNFYHDLIDAYEDLPSIELFARYQNFESHGLLPFADRLEKNKQVVKSVYRMLDDETKKKLYDTYNIRDIKYLL